MTPEELKQAIADINTKAAKEIHQLKVNYAKEHNPYKIGDVITDHIGSIEIISIGIYISDLPECFYRGIELNKDGRHNKKGNKRDVFQSQIVTNK